MAEQLDSDCSVQQMTRIARIEKMTFESSFAGIGFRIADRFLVGSTVQLRMPKHRGARRGKIDLATRIAQIEKWTLKVNCCNFLFSLSIIAERAPNPPEYAQPSLSKSKGGHPQRKGANLGVFVPVSLALLRCDGASACECVCVCVSV